jgi:6,7-dimethyl-8-ribityllumazine synthase
MAEEAAHRPLGVAYDGYIALGTVIRGETYHFEVVSNESARGLMDLAIGKRLAIGNGILTVEDEEQAWARARASEGDKGGGAARAALTMVALKQQMLAGKR